MALVRAQFRPAYAYPPRALNRERFRGTWMLPGAVVSRGGVCATSALWSSRLVRHAAPNASASSSHATPHRATCQPAIGNGSGWWWNEPGSARNASPLPQHHHPPCTVTPHV